MRELNVLRRRAVHDWPRLQSSRRGENSMAYQYKVLGKAVTLDVDPSVVAVRFQDNQPHSARAHATEAAGAGPFTRRFEVPGEKLTIVPVEPIGTAPHDAGAPKSLSAIRSLNAQP